MLAIVIYFAVTLVQVWLTSRQYDPHPAGAILVMGAAAVQRDADARPQSRLDEALKLYRQGYAHLVVVTGGQQPGDIYTEAEVGKMYLVGQGVPAADILEAGGNDSYENIADATPELKAHGVHRILVTTDPFHEYRSMAIASDWRSSPSPTPTQDSPITGWSTVPYFVKEAVAWGWAGSSGTTTWTGCTTPEGARPRRIVRGQVVGCLEGDADDGALALHRADADDAGEVTGGAAVAVADDAAANREVGGEGAFGGNGWPWRR